MNREALVKVLLVNAIALSILYGRFKETETGQKFHLEAQALMSRLWPQPHPNCGLMKFNEYTIISQRVILPDGIRPAAVTIKDGKIKSISDDVTQTGPRTFNFKNEVIMPGVIDVHVHLNEPGREDWEGILTGTRAAAAGGITTVIDMPLNSNPTTTTAERLAIKQRLAKAKAHVNVGHWAGLVPSNAADHAALARLVSGGVAGFKCFMCPSGINDFEHVTSEDIAAALPFLRKAGVPLMVHAELVHDLPAPEGDPTDYATYMYTRPPSFEQEAIKTLIELLDKATAPAAPGFVVHIAHLADASVLPLIQEAQTRHPITVETCAHYLQFHSGQVQPKQTWFKCAPPLRDADNQQALVHATASGPVLSIVSSDHSPAPPSMKQMETGDFLKAWGGISGLQYLLPATWTALKTRGEEVAMLGRLADLLVHNPAQLAGLASRKGQLTAGYDADIVVWDPDAEADTSTEANQHQHKVSPYTDVKLHGKVTATIVKGHFVHMVGAHSQQACGGPVKRESTA